MTQADLLFLKKLVKNNNREWFNDHKEQYEAAKDNFLALVGAFIFGMSETDESIGGIEPRDCVFRIYRDVRFSKDKSPYKTHFGAFICAGGRKSLTVPGYYLHVEPGNRSIFGSGLYMPEKATLLALRQNLSSAQSSVAKALLDKKLRKEFPLLLEDDKAAKVPRGFEKESRHADLLRLRHFFPYTNLRDEEMTATKLVERLVKKGSLLCHFNQVLLAAL